MLVESVSDDVDEAASEPVSDDVSEAVSESVSDDAPDAVVLSAASLLCEFLSDCCPSDVSLPDLSGGVCPVCLPESLPKEFPLEPLPLDVSPLDASPLGLSPLGASPLGLSPPGAPPPISPPGSPPGISLCVFVAFSAPPPAVISKSPSSICTTYDASMPSPVLSIVKSPDAMYTKPFSSSSAFSE